MTIFSEEKLFFAAACSNFVLLVAEIITFVLSVTETGAEIFIRFCGISNLLVLLSSFFALLSVYCNVRKGCGTNPQSHIFRYVATCLSTVTLFVFLLVLLPHEKDPKELLCSTSDWLFYVVCPLLSLLSFLLFEKEESRNLSFICVPIPVAIVFVYGIVMVALNFAGVYSGPYFFFRVLEQPTYVVTLSLFGMAVGAAAISFLLCLGNKKIFFRGVIHG